MSQGRALGPRELAVDDLFGVTWRLRSCDWAFRKSLGRSPEQPRNTLKMTTAKVTQKKGTRFATIDKPPPQVT